MSHLGRKLAPVGGCVLVLFLCATVAFGQGVITNIKVGPVPNSTTVPIPLAFHPGDPVVTPIPGAGWVGARMQFHVLDPTEINGGGYQPMGGGPGSQGGPIMPASQARMYTYWIPGATGSGIVPQPSVNLNLGQVNVHVTGTDQVSQNSDVDATIGFWQIWHLRGGPGSTLIDIPHSAYWYAASQFPDHIYPGVPELQPYHIVTAQNYSAYELPPYHPYPGEGHWAHVSEAMRFHLPGGVGSAFFAIFSNTATIGIEHIPEPAGAVLAVGGLASLCVGMVLRHRRGRTA